MTHRRLVFALLSLALLAACGEGTAPSPTNYTAPPPQPEATRTPLAAPAAITNALVPPAGSIYFGAYVDTSGLLGGATPADVLSLEASLGRTLTLHMEYQSFTAIFNSSSLQADFAEYRIPVVSWNCAVPNSQIVAGNYDSTIALKAQEIKAYGWPVFLRFFWDPNLPSTMENRADCYNLADKASGSGAFFSPALYVQAWDHVRAIFSQQGVTNVVWLWTYSTNSNGTSAAAYYPGPSEVDWVGVDDYDSTGDTFQNSFSTAYNVLLPYGKPMMIAETGAPSSAQTAFFSAAAPALQSDFPQIRAFLYYDGIDYTTGQNQDWRVTTTAFPSFLNFSIAPYMSASYAQ